MERVPDMTCRCVCGLKVTTGVRPYLQHLALCAKVAPWINVWAAEMLDKGDVERRTGVRG